MKYYLLIQFLALLAVSSPLACRPVATRTANAAPEGFGEVVGHHVVKIFPRSASKSLGASSPLVLPQVMFEGDDGIYWIGGLTTLHTYDESKEEWKDLVAGDSAVPLNVDTICQSADHKIWLRSVLYHSLRTYDGRRWKTNEQIGSDQTSRLPQVMFQGPAGRIWVVLKEGISAYDGKGWSRWYLPSLEAEEVYERLTDTLPNSVSKLEAVRKRWTRSTLARNHQATDEKRAGLITDVRVALEARSGCVWLGSRSALIAFHPASNEWQVHALPLHSGNPRRLFEDNDGGLWLADDNGQMMFFDPDHLNWTTYDLRNLTGTDSASVFSALLINGICQDRQGRVIVGSNNGVISFDQTKRAWELFAGNITISNSNVISTMQDTRGRIWLGTTEGILILQE